jgi:small subunit ribosomal protein S8
MMTDPISDMLSRIRNAALARHDRAEMPHSVLKERVAHVLKSEGYLDDVRVSDPDNGVGRVLTLILRYGKGRESAGRRVYVRHDHIPKVQSGMGISILSTSRGVMTDVDARKQRVGGELLCEVW